MSAPQFLAVPSSLLSLDSRWTQDGPGALHGHPPRPGWSLTLGSGGEWEPAYLPAQGGHCRTDVLTQSPFGEELSEVGVVSTRDPADNV